MAALAVGVVLTTGCQSNAAPPPLESTSPSPTPSPSPTQAVAPALPPEAEGTDEAAAKAFVRHYIELINYAMLTGDTSGLRALSSPVCSTCAAIVDRIDKVYGNGGHLEGAGWTPISLTIVATSDDAPRLVAAGIRIDRQIAYEGANSAPSESPKSRGNLDFYLAREPVGWRVKRLDATQ